MTANQSNKQSGCGQPVKHGSQSAIITVRQTSKQPIDITVNQSSKQSASKRDCQSITDVVT
eukprot:10009385-Lingulodinium_polyedra.AAC.1